VHSIHIAKLEVTRLSFPTILTSKSLIYAFRVEIFVFLRKIRQLSHIVFMLGLACVFSISASLAIKRR
jgi:hypothetical protein